MKALAIRKHGALDQVAVLDVPPAAVARGSVRVDLRAAALNHLDLFVIAGIPGIELSISSVQMIFIKPLTVLFMTQS